MKRAEAVAEFSESAVWTAGEDGLETFYVYGLLAAHDKIFAFSEGRIERHDKAAHHIVLKISDDGGATWSQNKFVVESRHGECFNNPTAVFEKQSGTIFLFYARNFENDRTEIYVVSSQDDGRSWTEPRNLIELFENNKFGWTLHLPGPGHGVETRGGRLIIQIWHRRELALPAAERRYGVSVIYSDDRGASWRTGGIVPSGDAQLNESRIIELADGGLLLNARSGAFVTSHRYSSRSADGGLTWTKAKKIESLAPAFATDAGFVNLRTGEKDLLILTRPDGKNERRNLCVYSSCNAGASWRFERIVYAGVAGYSDAVALPDRTIGVIYGRDLLDAGGDVEGNVRRTVFARLNLARREEN